MALKLNALKKSTNIAPDATFRWFVPNWQGEGPCPFIDLAPATAENPRWVQARMAWEKSPEGMRIIKAGAKTAAALDEGRDVDVRMFARVLVKGWGNFREDDAKEDIKFDASNVAQTEEILRGIGLSNFDDLRMAARQPQERLTPVELGGN